MLETERLILTPVGEAHTASVHRLHTDPLVVDALFKGVPPAQAETERRVRSYVDGWANNGFGYFCVYVKNLEGRTEFVGRSGLRHLEGTTEVEFGHCYLSERTGLGIAPEAGKAVIAFAFRELNLKRIVSAIDPGNRRSIRAAAKLGFRYVDDRWLYGAVMGFYEVTADPWVSADVPNLAPAATRGGTAPSVVPVTASLTSSGARPRRPTEAPAEERSRRPSKLRRSRPEQPLRRDHGCGDLGEPSAG